MPLRNYPNDIFEQGADMLAACTQLPAATPFGAHSPETLSTDLAQARDIQRQIDTLEKQLTDLRGKRDTILSHGWDCIKRMRALVKSLFGDDSTEYSLVGGTPLSARRRRAHKTPAAEA